MLLYLAIAAGAVTHEDLFFEKAVKLPFLGIELPLVAFFALAPLIFLVGHAYTLVHLAMLTDKAKGYHEALHKRMGDKDGLSQEEPAERKAKRDGLRRQLPSNIFVQFLAGPKQGDFSERLFRRLLHAIPWVTLAIAPVLMLLMMQIQFLPYHSSFVTCTQRVALGLDLALIWWLWLNILSGLEMDDWARRRAAWLWRPLGVALSLVVLLLSVTVVTFPGEWQEELPSWPILPAMDEWGKPATETDAKRNLPTALLFRDWVVYARRVSLHDWLFNAKPDVITFRRLPFSSTLRLRRLREFLRRLI